MRFSDSDVKLAFGFQPKQKWPAAGLVRRSITILDPWARYNGVTGKTLTVDAWVNPLPELSATTKRRRFALRVYCVCPVCAQVMPLGRLVQHTKIHKGE